MNGSSNMEHETRNGAPRRQSSKPNKKLSYITNGRNNNT